MAIHTNNPDELAGKIFFGKYKPEKKLGEGSFGRIYSAINVSDGEHYALKMESRENGQNLLEGEAYYLCYLKGYGIPAVKSYGFSGSYNIMVMELLGKSLEDLFQENKKHFSLKTVCLIAIQMIDRLERIHNKHIIHRDIKPDNFVIGLNKKNNIIYLLDFGLAKKYRSSRTLQHIKFTVNKKLTGTARYASINALRGCEQSRRDDLEAVGYVLMYFLRGTLPWQGLKVQRKEERYKKIYEKKKNTTPEELCKGYPEQLCEYVKYTRNMEFEQNPNYDYLRNLFFKILEYSGVNINRCYFEWSKDNPIIFQNNINNNNQHEYKNEYKNENKNDGLKEESDTFSKELMNQHLLTTNNFNEENNNNNNNNYNNKKYNYSNERMNTQFANYNTTIQVTENDINNNDLINNNNTTIENKYNVVENNDDNKNNYGIENNNDNNKKELNNNFFNVNSNTYNIENNNKENNKEQKKRKKKDKKDKDKSKKEKLKKDKCIIF